MGSARIISAFAIEDGELTPPPPKPLSSYDDDHILFLTENKHPAFTIEDGELTLPPTPRPLSTYDDNHGLFFAEDKHQSIETINLDNQITSTHPTMTQNILAYILSYNEKTDIFKVLVKFANNQIQFSQDGATIDLLYIQKSSRKEYFAEYKDELDKIFKRGKQHAVDFANTLVKLNNLTKELSEKNPSEAVANLRVYIKNIAADTKHRVEEKFSNNSSVTAEYTRMMEEMYSTMSFSKTEVIRRLAR